MLPESAAPGSWAQAEAEEPRKPQEDPWKPRRSLEALRFGLRFREHFWHGLSCMQDCGHCFVLQFPQVKPVWAPSSDRMALSRSWFCDKLAQPSGTIPGVGKVFPGGLSTALFVKMVETKHQDAASQTIVDPAEAPSQVFLGMTAIIVSEAMQRLMEVVQRVARSSATTLITGESGVGKELVARAVHYHSGRVGKPWVDFNCAALPEQLLESELFGHERGAFSGADTAKPGLFELAHQGTIFLDEVGELDARLQVKLLRVLDGAPYYRLGGVRKVSVDVRVVAATNRDLERAVAQGRFRSDLFHRLSQFTLHVPPLRSRPADIEPLAKHFLAEHFPELELGSSAACALRNYSWPGTSGNYGMP